MSKRIISALILFIMIFSAGFSTQPKYITTATERPQTEVHPWLTLMSFVPQSAVETGSANRGFIHFADLKMLFEIRHVEPPEHFSTIDDLGDSEQERLIRATLYGYVDIPSASMLLVQHLVGLDFFDLHTTLSYGNPPSDVSIVTGDFDAATVQTMLEEKGFEVVETVDEVILMCGQYGCDAGAGSMLLADNIIVGSFDFGALQEVLAAHSEEGASLHDMPDYRAAVNIGTKSGRFIQGMTLPPDSIMDVVPRYFSEGQTEAFKEVYGLNLSAEEREALLLPQYSLVFMVDVAEGTNEVVCIGLIYDNEEDALSASDQIETKINEYVTTTFNSALTENISLREILDRRNTSLGSILVEYDEETERYATLIPFYAPLPSNNPDENGRFETSSLVYSRFHDFAVVRDLLWLATPAWFQE